MRRGLLASYLERGNRSLTTRANGDESVTELKQLDDFFNYSDDNPGPSVVTMTVDTAREFVKKRRAENAGNAVINRSLACLRRMLRIAHEDGKIQNVPVIRLQKEPPARRGFVELQQFEQLVAALRGLNDYRCKACPIGAIADTSAPAHHVPVLRWCPLPR